MRNGKQEPGELAPGPDFRAAELGNGMPEIQRGGTCCRGTCSRGALGDGQPNLLAIQRGKLVSQETLDPPEGETAQGEPGEETSAVFAEVSCPGQERVAGGRGAGRRFPERDSEEARHPHGADYSMGGIVSRRPVFRGGRGLVRLGVVRLGVVRLGCRKIDVLLS